MRSTLLSLARPALVVVLVVVTLLTLLWLLQRKLIYFPDGAAVPPAATVLAGARDVTLRTTDGLDLGAWLVPPRGPDRQVSVLIANGNAGNREARAPLAEALSGHGFTVLLFDYRGYGGNLGSPHEAGLALDARAAYRYLVEAHPGHRIYFYGESIGAAVVTELATGHPPAGLILRSPFEDLPAVGAHHYPFLPVRLLARDRYPVAEQIATITVPTLILYGAGDTVIPSGQSREVAARAAGPVTVVEVPGADHNDYALLAGPQLIEAVVTFAIPR